MIRPYKSSDKNEVFEIYNAAKLDELENESTQFLLIPLEHDPKRNALIFNSTIAIYDSGKPCGFVAYGEGCINGLYVRPGSRGQGIGRLLLDFAVSALGGHAYLQVTCSNSVAINLYRNYGFKSVSQYDAEYNGCKVAVNKMIFGRPGDMTPN